MDDNQPLVYERGNEVLFLYDLERGDPDYIKYWERVQQDKAKFNFNHIDQGLKNALNQKVVIWSDEIKVNGYFKSNPEDVREVLHRKRHFCPFRHAYNIHSEFSCLKLFKAFSPKPQKNLQRALKACFFWHSV